MRTKEGHTEEGQRKKKGMTKEEGNINRQGKNNKKEETICEVTTAEAHKGTVKTNNQQRRIRDDQ